MTRKFRIVRFALLGAVLVVGTVGLAFWLDEYPRVSPEPDASAEEISEAEYTNRLGGETSPYLRLHRHNPVDWYPWGTEAFEKARAEDKPIFLSVGYSSCYWCHVMERLVFSNGEIAALMNRMFVNVKVDREERPDVDAIYMTATQLMTGQGGWPNSVFLTPDLKPFFAGTYFPPEDAHGRPGFPRLLKILGQAWEEDRASVEQRAEQMAQQIRSVHADGVRDTSWSHAGLIDLVRGRLENRLDWRNGGFVGAPKFPPDHALGLLMDLSRDSTQTDLKDWVLLTLDQMALGGIRDHLGGGFHRYATDAEWRVPHFEKMLYNQALLSWDYLNAFQMTGRETYRAVAEDIFRFVSHTMTDSLGGFYTALDAETDAEEGAYYVWTEAEIREVLQAEADLFFAAFALAPVDGSTSGVLYRVQSDSALARDEGLTIDVLQDRLAGLKNRLLAHRKLREMPLLDDKIIVGWNGLMIAAYARSYRVLGRAEDLTRARRAAQFVLDKMHDDSGMLYRVYHSGRRKIPAYQADYAFFIRGLIELYRASNERRYLTEAQSLSDVMHRRFWDVQNGGYFFTAFDTELFVRAKQAQDAALPSGNAVALHDLIDLYDLTEERHYAERADSLFAAFAAEARNAPEAYLHLIHGALRLPDVHMGDAAVQIVSGSSQIDARVEMKSLASLPGDTARADVVIHIAPGWHIQSARPDQDFLIPTRVQVVSRDSIDVIDIAYPEPHEQLPGLADTPVSVYTNSVRIGVAFRVFSRDSSRARVAMNLTFQACDKQRCLQPETRVLPINVFSDGQ